jgi:MSHA biogenesis protein MshN
MSLINKMLQDLDARGTPATESFPSQIRPVAHQRQGLAERFSQRSIALAAAGACAACAAVALAWFGWAHFQQPRAANKPAAIAGAAAAVRPAPAAIKPVQGMTGTIKTGPASASASAPLPAAQRRSAVPLEPDSEDARAARRAIMSELQARMTAGAAPALKHGSKHESKHASKPESKHASTRESKRESTLEAKRASKKEERRERKAALLAQARAGTETAGAAAALAPKGRRSTQGRQESASQRAEGEYRRALASLPDGRMTETVAALEQALRLDPGHDAARQTLVGLLIEAKRPDEAMRHLQAGLALDARQPALAMLLARLQIERGGSGIETLTRTLPYAGNHADYHAFLAGALEREQRHREAAEQYQVALRIAPANGVWWMGLGMALQADKRNAEALEAFQRARASGTLSGELQAFVERRLQQLGR